MGLLDFIRSHGYSFEPTQLDGKFHEYADSLGNKGWYVGSELSTGKITLTFGDWRRPDQSHSFISEQQLTSEESDELKRTQEKFQTEKCSRQEQAKRNAQEIFARWERIGPGGESKYLAGKALPSRFPGTIVKPAEVGGHVLVIPLRDEHGTLWNFQSIFDSGDKLYFKFARTSGLFFEIPGKDKTVICEGFATGASIHIATGFTVIVAFTLGNLRAIATKFPGAAIACDYDGKTSQAMKDKGHHDPHNPGLRVGMKVAFDLARELFSPVHDFTCQENIDYSDLFISQGVDGVRKSFETPCHVDLPDLNKDDLAGNTSPPNTPPTPTAANVQYDPDGIYVGDIDTYSTGFHWSELKRGGQIVWHPDYEDLRKYFERKTGYRILGESGICHTWNGKFYEPLGDIFIQAFAQEHFEPSANNHKVNEFVKLVLRTNVEPVMFFNVERKINFANGYLDLETKEFHPHSKEIGFRFALPYEYNREAKAPAFQRFLDRVTVNDKGLQQILLEFMGYALSGDSCWAQKALVLTGEGSNGKSTFMNVMRSVGGDNAHTPMTLGELKNEYKLQLLDGKLFNMAEETPSKALVDSSAFKNLVGGGTVIVRQIYKAPYPARMKAKLIFACNDLPKSDDTTHAFYRRFLICPFRATFSKDQPDYDPFIEESLVQELSGIFNLALAGYFELKKRKAFPDIEAVNQAIDEFKTTSDPLRYWVHEDLKIHPLGNGHDLVWVSMAELYSEYKLFCLDSELNPVSKIDFGRKLARLIPDYDKRCRKAGERTASKDSRQRGLIGLTHASGEYFASNKLFAEKHQFDSGGGAPSIPREKDERVQATLDY